MKNNDSQAHISAWIIRNVIVGIIKQHNGSLEPELVCKDVLGILYPHF